MIDKNIGKTFNHLTILEIDNDKIIEQKEKQATKIRKYYKCECSCGTICSIRADSVLNGHTTSCGCARIKAATINGKSKINDLTNQRFGKLLVLKRDEEYIGKVKWICQCDCGNICSVFSSNLVTNHTKSCGCITNSIGEENIEKILKENNIEYAKEYSFPNLKDKKILRFDFAIFKNNKLIELIEFDGRQHFNDYTPWKSKEMLEERQKRDLLKNKFCEENNLKLIRINYENRDNITLKLLDLENY